MFNGVVMFYSFDGVICVLCERAARRRTLRESQNIFAVRVSLKIKFPSLLLVIPTHSKSKSSQHEIYALKPELLFSSFGRESTEKKKVFFGRWSTPGKL